jgi:RHS repeat-associated protein
VIIEDGSFEQRYVYDTDGQRLSAEFSHSDGTGRGTTNANSEYGENPASDFAVNDIGKVWYRVNMLGTSLYVVDAAYEIRAHAEYDAWGDPLTETYADTNYSGLEELTSYTTYSWDITLELYFAQNRFYDAETHRFTQQDPAKDGGNWYVYVGGNPLTWVDPWGLEKIVVSGGIYSQTKQESGRYAYEFIESALKQLRDWRIDSPEENLTLIVANEGWTFSSPMVFESIDYDKIAFNVTQIKSNSGEGKITLIFIDNKTQLFSYINNMNIDSKNYGNRKQDQISSLVVFSHGFVNDGGIVSLGYNYEDTYNTDLDIKKTDLAKLNSRAFINNGYFAFFSCNTGTAGSNSFAQEWANITGGTTLAFSGKTSYAEIRNPVNIPWYTRPINWVIDRIEGMLNLIEMRPADNMPKAATDGKEIIFTPKT